MWNIIGSTLSAFISLFFAIIVTRINGVDDAGIFMYSFATACILYVVGIYLGRTFQVTDITDKYSDTDYIYNRIITCVLMLLIGLVFCLIRGYDLYKTTILILLCSFRAIEAFCESLYAVIQKREQLHKVGKSLAAKAVLDVIVFLITDIVTKNVILSCISICIVDIAVMILYDFKNVREVDIKKTRYSNKKNNMLLKIGFATFVLTLLSQYIINAARYAIDDLGTNEWQTIFGIIIMPATFMGILCQYIIQPILTKIAKQIKEKQYNDLSKLISQIFLIIGILGFFVLIVAYFLGIPVLELIYGIELSEYFISFMIIIGGSIFFGLETVISTVLIAMRKTEGQAVIFLIVSIISTVIANRFVIINGILGASISYLITMILISVLLFIYMVICIKIRKNKEKN